MNKKDILGFPAPTPPEVPVLLEAEPEPLEIDLQRTALIVVDMQNAFVSRGGMFDVWGFDILSIQKVIQPIKRISRAARARGCKVVYITHRYSPDLHDSGGPSSPHWHKVRALKDYLEHPERRDSLIIRGTWGAGIVEELEPQEGDIVVEKPRYSAFFGTNLDVILRAFNIKYLIFAGVATNICVEDSIRDAHNLEYFPVLISDAAMNAGPDFMQEATIFNVTLTYGWVTTTEKIMKAIDRESVIDIN
jgi:ureidoacrylate peracid hydrolase